jgi:hypothetical protein
MVLLWTTDATASSRQQNTQRPTRSSVLHVLAQTGCPPLLMKLVLQLYLLQRRDEHYNLSLVSRLSRKLVHYAYRTST